MLEEEDECLSALASLLSDEDPELNSAEEDTQQFGETSDEVADILTPNDRELYEKEQASHCEGGALATSELAELRKQVESLKGQLSQQSRAESLKEQLIAKRQRLQSEGQNLLRNKAVKRFVAFPADEHILDGTVKKPSDFDSFTSSASSASSGKKQRLDVPGDFFSAPTITTTNPEAHGSVVRPLSVDEFTEKYSKVKLKPGRKISVHDLDERLKQARIVTLAGVAAAATLEGDWVCFGVIANKSEPKPTAKGGNFMILKLTDLKMGVMTMVSVFLFGKAFDAYWKEKEGLLVCLANAKMLPRTDTHKGLALSISSAQQLCIIGEAAEFDHCAGYQKGSMVRCQNVVAKTGSFCPYHVKAQYMRMAAGRMDVNRCPDRAFTLGLHNALPRNLSAGTYKIGIGMESADPLAPKPPQHRIPKNSRFSCKELLDLHNKTSQSYRLQMGIQDKEIAAQQAKEQLLGMKGLKAPPTLPTPDRKLTGFDYMQQKQANQAYHEAKQRQQLQEALADAQGIVPEPARKLPRVASAAISALIASTLPSSHSSTASIAKPVNVSSQPRISTSSANTNATSPTKSAAKASVSATSSSTKQLRPSFSIAAASLSPIAAKQSVQPPASPSSSSAASKSPLPKPKTALSSSATSSATAVSSPTKSANKPKLSATLLSPSAKSSTTLDSSAKFKVSQQVHLPTSVSQTTSSINIFASSATITTTASTVALSQSQTAASTLSSSPLLSSGLALSTSVDLSSHFSLSSMLHPELAMAPSVSHNSTTPNLSLSLSSPVLAVSSSSLSCSASTSSSSSTPTSLSSLLASAKSNSGDVSSKLLHSPVDSAKEENKSSLKRSFSDSNSSHPSKRPALSSSLPSASSTPSGKDTLVLFDSNTSKKTSSKDSLTIESSTKSSLSLHSNDNKINFTAAPAPNVSRKGASDTPLSSTAKPAVSTLLLTTKSVPSSPLSATKPLLSSTTVAVAKSSKRPVPSRAPGLYVKQPVGISTPSRQKPGDLPETQRDLQRKADYFERQQRASAMLAAANELQARALKELKAAHGGRLPAVDPNCTKNPPSSAAALSSLATGESGSSGSHLTLEDALMLPEDMLEEAFRRGQQIEEEPVKLKVSKSAVVTAVKKKMTDVFGDLDMSSAEGKKLLEARSLNSHLADQTHRLQRQELFDVMEKKEEMLEQMAATKSVMAPAFECAQCHFVSPCFPPLCREKGHAVKKIQAKKRFFQCDNCKQKTTTLNLRLPNEVCPHCRKKDWMPTGMMTLASEKPLNQQLLVRGDEHAFGLRD